MLIAKKMTDGLNAQVGREYTASMQYLAMAAWFEEKGLGGFAQFFHKQSEEERQHGLKLVRYLGDVGGKVEIPEIPKPRTDFPSVEQALVEFLESEQDVTRAVFALVELADAEKDYSAHEFLQWFVAEQREEVSSAAALLERARGFGEERIAILDGMIGHSNG